MSQKTVFDDELTQVGQSSDDTYDSLPTYDMRVHSLV